MTLPQTLGDRGVHTLDSSPPLGQGVSLLAQRWLQPRMFLGRGLSGFLPKTYHSRYESSGGTRVPFPWGFHFCKFACNKFWGAGVQCSHCMDSAWGLGQEGSRRNWLLLEGRGTGGHHRRWWPEGGAPLRASGGWIFGLLR